MNAPTRQQGIVLMVSLVLLLLLTIIAITAANLSTLQLRMASNSQQQNIAFQAAESGLRHGQELIDGGTETETLTISGDQTNGVIPGYRVETAITPLSGYSLNADLGSNDRINSISQVRIISRGKTCDADADAETCAEASDNSSSAEHWLGCTTQRVSAPLCE